MIDFCAGPTPGTVIAPIGADEQPPRG